jgi:hypothetical protein
MKKVLLLLLTVAMFVVPLVAAATPVTGIYRSTDYGPGNLVLTGRASTWRPGVNSGLPHVLHAQSWDGTTLALGTQWEIVCPVENTQFSTQDWRDGQGTGIVRYTSTFQGGTFTFFPGGWPWGSGTGTLNTTSMVTDVQYYLWQPVGSVVNGNTSGVFSNGCVLSFVIGNGAGMGETPYLSKPADYPTFLDASCGPAPPLAQFGTWGNVLTITVGINCVTPAHQSTWGAIKTIYR